MAKVSPGPYQEQVAVPHLCLQSLAQESNPDILHCGREVQFVLRTLFSVLFGYSCHNIFHVLSQLWEPHPLVVGTRMLRPYLLPRLCLCCPSWLPDPLAVPALQLQILQGLWSLPELHSRPPNTGTPTWADQSSKSCFQSHCFLGLNAFHRRENNGKIHLRLHLSSSLLHKLN